jgi:outer membrane protein assembly factor BamB
LAEGLVLAIDGGVLTAFDASTGELRWTAGDTQGLTQSPVAAHGYAYVGSKTTTYAVDLKTGTVVWQDAVAGSLTLGGGRLLVGGSDGILRTYILTQTP